MSNATETSLGCGDLEARFRRMYEGLVLTSQSTDGTEVRKFATLLDAYLNSKRARVQVLRDQLAAAEAVQRKNAATVAQLRFRVETARRKHATLAEKRLTTLSLHAAAKRRLAENRALKPALEAELATLDTHLCHNGGRQACRGNIDAAVRCSSSSSSPSRCSVPQRQIDASGLSGKTDTTHATTEETLWKEHQSILNKNRQLDRCIATLTEDSEESDELFHRLAPKYGVLM